MLAKNLFDIGEFFKRTKKTKAAAIYYETVIKRFSETRFSERSRKRLISLNTSKKQVNSVEKDDKHNQVTAKGEDLPTLHSPE